MPPKSSVVLGSVSYHEGRLDDITRMMINFVELKCGFGEKHILSRTLQSIFKQFDLDHTGELSPKEFAKTLDFMNIKTTPDELDGIFQRFDSNLSGTLSHKEFADGAFGLSRAPFGNLDVRVVMKKIQEKMLSRAAANSQDGVVRSLTRSLIFMDKNHSNTLSKEEMFNGLQKYGVHCTLSDVDVLVKRFDNDSSGDISITEFLRAIRGHMPKARRALVNEAFACIDINGNGCATLDEISQCYDASNHPRVVSGEATEKTILSEFISSWDGNSDSKITAAEFEEYYEDISAGIDRDDYFELMIRNVWHLSGGKGQAENTSCRRVLVSYRDGSQSIEEIVNDLGIGNDKKKMQHSLEARGIENIIKIELYM